VSFKPTAAYIFSAVWLLPTPAGGARLRRVGFTDALDGHSVQSRLVLDHANELTVGPLVEPLVRLGSVVQTFADSSQVTHYNRSDPSFGEGLDFVVPGQFDVLGGRDKVPTPLFLLLQL